jgi:acyl-CoA thioesterase-1
MFKACLRIFSTAGLLLAAIAGAHAEGALKGVGLGDSLMAGFQLPPGDAFPVRLEAALREAGYDVTIANAGVSGDTTSAGLARLDWSVPDDTDFVILELGANDALRGISPEITRRNLEDMVTRLQARNIEVVLVGMLAPPNLGNDYADAFNPIYPELADTYDLIYYPFFLDGVIGNQERLLSDGMHPNGNGVTEMVRGFLPTMKSYLEGKGD